MRQSNNNNEKANLTHARLCEIIRITEDCDVIELENKDKITIIKAKKKKRLELPKERSVFEMPYDLV